MIDNNLQNLTKLVKKGLKQGFSASYIMHQLSRKGHKHDQLERALKLATNPEEEEVIEEIPKEEVVEEEEEPDKELTYEDMIKPKREHHERKKRAFKTFKDPESLIMIIILSILFFILGIIVDRLILIF